MNLNVDMSIFWDFNLISMLKRSVSFSNFNRNMKPDQSILIYPMIIYFDVNDKSFKVFNIFPFIDFLVKMAL